MFIPTYEQIAMLIFILMSVFCIVNYILWSIGVQKDRVWLKNKVVDIYDELLEINTKERPRPVKQMPIRRTRVRLI